MRRTSLACVTLLLACALAAAEDWPGWRGPRRDGTADSATYPTTWSDTQNVRWKAAIPGVGHSSPVVAKGKVYLTTCLESAPGEKKPRQLIRLDRTTGDIDWAVDVLAAPLEKMHKLNSRASSTPVTDGEHIYLTFLDDPALRVYCYTLDGKMVWEKSPGEFHSVHGFCSSPLLHGDLLIVNGDQDPAKDGKAYLVAFDKKTGEQMWRTDRPNRLRSYCPPILGTVDGKPQMVLTGSKCVAGFDPDTGKQLWIVSGPTEQFVSSPVFSKGLVFLTAGFPDHWVMAIDPTGRGDVTKTHVKWSKKNEGGYVPSPVAFDGLAFAVHDEGICTCWDVATGELFWKRRLGGHHTGSGVVAGGNVYFTDDEGVTFVFPATKEEPEAPTKNKLGERCFTSPAFSDGDIFIRGDKHLIFIGTKK